jgi:polyhydroxybutyrate depolymerase
LESGRTFRTIVRKDHESTKAAPVLVALHGHATDSGVLVNVYRLVDLAVVERDYVLVVAHGLRNAKGDPFWNASPACCDHDRTNPDDVGYLRDVLTAVKKRHAVDAKRVYAIGVSNGAFMAHRWATEPSTELSGIIAISGVDDPNQGVAPRRTPVRVLQVHGDADDLIRYRGGKMVAPYPSARETIDAWRRRNRCEAIESARVERVDLFDRPTLTETWACGSARTALWTVKGGDHYLRPTPAFTTAALSFLEAR